MLLTELFDTKVPYRVTVNTEKKWAAKAEINGRTIEFEAEKHFGNKNNWDFYFSEHKDGEISMGRTGSGGELKVLSFVKTCMKEVIDLRKPDNIFFSAHKDKEGEEKKAEDRDESRGNVYEKLCKLFRTQYTYKRESKRIKDLFHMTRIPDAA